MKKICCVKLAKVEYCKLYKQKFKHQVVPFSKILVNICNKGIANI